MGRIRSRFLRACVEIIHQETGGAALPRLREGLPPALRGMLRDVLSSTERDASVDLGPGLELLLGIDGVLCGGSGLVTTRIATSLASRVLSQSAGLVVAGDTVTTLQHLRAPFEHPFLEVSLHFAARRMPDGFTLELNLPHEQRATRWLAAAGLGYAKAATQFSGESTARLRLYADGTGNLARVLGRNTDSGVVTLITGSTGNNGASSSAGRDGSRPARRASGPTNAAARVDQILSRAPRRAAPPSEPPAPTVARSAGLGSGTRAKAIVSSLAAAALPARTRKSARS